MEYNIPKSKLFRFDKLISHNNINLLIPGQGVFIFEYPEIQQPCSICFYNQDKTDGLKVDIYVGSVKINRLSICDPLIDPDNKVGLVDKKGAYYWISLDAQNQVLSVGIGEARIETIIYKYQFKFQKDADDYRKENKKFLESLCVIEISKESNSLKPLKLLRDPICNKIPLIVRNTEKLSMNDIAKGTYLPKANLSLMAQKLYDCIAGKNFVLDDKDFPEFSEAIEHSIITPGCWCYERLQEKSTEFNKDKPNLLETYLRITLGSNNGESPGIPYVLEIWPVGHYSPVHNHGASNAIIRVLHGSINVSLFPYLSASNSDKGGVERFGVADFVKDQITWISPTLNQIHQLKNLDTNKDTCITIQCYMYDNENTYHYDYFDYIDDNGKIEQYEPDSDMEFIEFKKLMKKEWHEMKKCRIFDIIKKCFNCF
jgi:hypothetical protein